MVTWQQHLVWCKQPPRARTEDTSYKHTGKITMDAHMSFDNVEAISGQSKLPLIYSPSVKLAAYS